MLSCQWVEQLSLNAWQPAKLAVASPGSPFIEAYIVALLISVLGFNTAMRSEVHFHSFMCHAYEKQMFLVETHVLQAYRHATVIYICLGSFFSHVVKKERKKDISWRSSQLSYTHTPPIHGYIRVYTRTYVYTPYVARPIYACSHPYSYASDHTIV
jgi:hypothetical protein